PGLAEGRGAVALAASDIEHPSSTRKIAGKAIAFDVLPEGAAGGKLRHHPFAGVVEGGFVWHGSGAAHADRGEEAAIRTSRPRRETGLSVVVGPPFPFGLRASIHRHGPRRSIKDRGDGDAKAGQFGFGSQFLLGVEGLRDSGTSMHSHGMEVGI